MYGIKADGLYAEDAAALAVGVPRSTLMYARRRGRIEFRRVGLRRRVVYKGQWLLTWLVAREAAEQRAERPGGHGA